MSDATKWAEERRERLQTIRRRMKEQHDRIGEKLHRLDAACCPAMQDIVPLKAQRLAEVSGHLLVDLQRLADTMDALEIP